MKTVEKNSPDTRNVVFWTEERKYTGGKVDKYGVKKPDHSKGEKVPREREILGREGGVGKGKSARLNFGFRIFQEKKSSDYWEKEKRTWAGREKKTSKVEARKGREGGKCSIKTT